jgi:hypothetical protein
MQSFFDMGKGEYQIMANLIKYEIEMVVNYNAGEQTATVYTRDKSVMRRLDRLVADYPESYKLLNQTEIDKTYSMPNNENKQKSRLMREGRAK